MNENLNGAIFEMFARKAGQKSGLILAAINIAMFILLQSIACPEIPVILKISIILIIGGLLIQNIRPRW